MDLIYDFSKDKRIFRNLGGTDRKFLVEHDNEAYMLKFSEAHAKRSDISTSYVNSVISEYISSHIAESMGLPTHQTVLGLYNDEVVVGCKDFRQPGQENIEFGEFVRGVFDSKDIKRVIRLDQIYKTMEDSNIFSPQLREQSIQRYWDTFVADALVGNFDRHMGNWGYLSNLITNTLTLAPTYDYGSTLLPQLADEGMQQLYDNKHHMLTRCMVFPSPALFILEEKAGKVGYYDLMSSNFDPNCTEAVKRMAPHINLNVISQIIDNTPLISNIRKEFYKRFIALRKEIIIDRAYNRCVNQNYDLDALERIKTGHQYQESMIDKDFANYSFPPNNYAADTRPITTNTPAHLNQLEQKFRTSAHTVREFDKELADEFLEAADIIQDVKQANNPEQTFQALQYNNNIIKNAQEEYNKPTKTRHHGHHR